MTMLYIGMLIGIDTIVNEFRQEIQLHFSADSSTALVVSHPATIGRPAMRTIGTQAKEQDFVVPTPLEKRAQRMRPSERIYTALFIAWMSSLALLLNRQTDVEVDIVHMLALPMAVFIVHLLGLFRRVIVLRGKVHAMEYTSSAMKWALIGVLVQLLCFACVLQTSLSAPAILPPFAWAPHLQSKICADVDTKYLTNNCIGSEQLHGMPLLCESERWPGAPACAASLAAAYPYASRYSACEVARARVPLLGRAYGLLMISVNVVLLLVLTEVTNRQSPPPARAPVTWQGHEIKWFIAWSLVYVVLAMCIPIYFSVILAPNGMLSGVSPLMRAIVDLRVQKLELGCWLVALLLLHLSRNAAARAKEKQTMSAINRPGKWDFFVSYTQTNDKARLLAERLTSRLKGLGYEVWYDIDMKDKSLNAMREGVENACVFLAVITGEVVGKPNSAYLERPFCLQELSWARKMGKHIQPVVHYEDKSKIGEILKHCSHRGAARHIGNIDFKHLDISSNDYFELGLNGIRQYAVSTGALPM